MLGEVSLRKVVRMDELVTGWGAVCESRIAKWKWPLSLEKAHINFLELLTVFQAMNYFCTC